MSKILLVEDNEDTIALVVKILTNAGLEAAYAPDAETGLSLARSLQPDLILLDLGLPDYDGQTLAGWLRVDPNTSKIPVVAFTAWPESAARPMVESYGCVGYIGKPINKVNEFIDQIKSYLK